MDVALGNADTYREYYAITTVPIHTNALMADARATVDFCLSFLLEFMINGVLCTYSVICMFLYTWLITTSYRPTSTLPFYLMSATHRSTHTCEISRPGQLCKMVSRPHKSWNVYENFLTFAIRDNHSRISNTPSRMCFGQDRMKEKKRQAFTVSSKQVAEIRDSSFYTSQSTLSHARKSQTTIRWLHQFLRHIAG